MVAIEFVRAAYPLPFLAAAFALVLPLMAAGDDSPSLEKPAPVDLRTLAAFAPASANWQIAGGLGGDSLVENTLDPVKGTGVLVNRPSAGARSDLVTTWTHRDLELEFDFLLPREGSLGVWLQGRYELRLGQRWNEVGRAPGLWQHVRVSFRAPQFEPSGEKTTAARLTRVELNGVVVERDAELPVSHTSGSFSSEASPGPLVFRGEGHAYAIRNLAVVRREATGSIQLRNSQFRFYEGAAAQFGAYDNTTPTRTGPAEKPAAEMVPSSRPFALVFTGTLAIAKAGRYFFSLETEPHAFSSARLMIDGKEIAGPVDLSAGEHRYRLDYLRGSTRGSPDLAWLAAAEGGDTQTLIRSTASLRNRPREPMLISAHDAITLQRCFFAHPTGKKTHAMTVASPAGVHFAYDPGTAALLAIWKGAFLDATEMWYERGFSQEGRPAGSTISLAGNSLFGPSYAARGYELAANGQPTFLGKIGEQPVEDVLVAANAGLTRTLTFRGGLSGALQLELASSQVIVPSGDRFIVGDRSHYIRAPGGAIELDPRSAGARLIVTLPAGATTFSYDIIW